MKVAIIGAGISGVSVAKILEEKGVSSVVFESEKTIGGLIKCDRIDGVLYHKVGGHVFNTKDEKVKKWFFSHFDVENEFQLATRNSKIEIQKNLVNYPIENFIHQLPVRVGEKIIRELLQKKEIEKENFGRYLETCFGKTLYELYFKPYNEKIWRRELNEIALEWLQDKLPMPDREDIIINNIYRKSETKMAHSTFFYPIKGGSQFIIERLSKNLNFRKNTTITEIKLINSNKWLINNEVFTHVIYTGNVKFLSTLLKPEGKIQINPEDFQSHGTTSVLCEVEVNDLSWLYLPENNTKAHRIIMTGNFSKFNNGEYGLTATVEFSEEIGNDEISREVRKIPWVKKVISSHYQKESYIIQGPNTRERILEIKETLANDRFYLLGRFAEWEYYNMDNAIKAAMNLTDEIC